MRTPEHVWLVVEGDKVVRGEMPSGDPSVFSVPVAHFAKDALEQMEGEGWQAVADEQVEASGNYRIHLVRDNPPE